MRNKQKGEDGKPAKAINCSLQTQCYKICVRVVVLAVVDLLKSDHRRINWLWELVVEIFQRTTRQEMQNIKVKGCEEQEKTGEEGKKKPN